MDPREHDRMAAQEERHFWFRGTRRVILAVLRRAVGDRPGRVLDLGCGTGFTLAQVEGEPRVGLDRSAHALAWARGKGGLTLARGEASALPFADRSFDVVLALDVLEHVDDDAGAAREAWRVLRPGGVLLATVPALRSLWSDHDEALEHRRRYRAGELRTLLSGAGFDAIDAGYYNFFLFPLVAASRILTRLRPRRGQAHSHLRTPPRPINDVLAAVLGAERHLALRVPFPVGVSIIAVARRPR